MPRARKGSIAGLSPTSKNVAVLFMRREEKLSEEQKAYLRRLCEADGSLADAHRLTQDFAAMVRELEGEKLDGWLDEAEACDAPAMRNFAAGLKKDLDTVRAGLTETWSNGPVANLANNSATHGRSHGWQKTRPPDAPNRAGRGVDRMLRLVLCSRFEGFRLFNVQRRSAKSHSVYTLHVYWRGLP